MPPPELLHHKHKNSNHSILVKTIGATSNPDGIGAKVTVVAGGLARYDEVRSGASYLSSSDLRLHFGLGSATRVDRLDVRWPSGRADVVKNASADRILVVKERAGLVESQP